MTETPPRCTTADQHLYTALQTNNLHPFPYMSTIPDLCLEAPNPVRSIHPRFHATTMTENPSPQARGSCSSQDLVDVPLTEETTSTSGPLKSNYQPAGESVPYLTPYRMHADGPEAASIASNTGDGGRGQLRGGESGDCCDLCIVGITAALCCWVFGEEYYD